MSCTNITTILNKFKEIISNNTKSLVEGDIVSLVEKPPLDSMDVIKTKLISLAKKDKIVLNSEELENMLINYRKELSKKIIPLTKLRNNELFQKIDEIADSCRLI